MSVRFRYRTAAIIGPWRDRREKAAKDAVASGLARRAGWGGNLEWLVPGDIEEGRGAPAPPINGD
jgi:hypothetical protein